MKNFHFWSLFLLTLLSLSVNLQADTAASFSAPEVTVGSVQCKAAWNEFCEDQKTIQVPDGYKLCNNTVSVKEQSGDSHYEITHADANGITVKFSAKGNRSRLTPEGASIDLSLSLQGVRQEDDCSGKGIVIKPTATNIDIAPPKPEPEPTATFTAPPKSPADLRAGPAFARKITVTPETVAETLSDQGKKVDACACSLMINADKVTECLSYGQTRDKANCNTLGAPIQCVSSQEACHTIHTHTCSEILGMDQTNSQKRIYVPNSVYCQLLLKK